MKKIIKNVLVFDKRSSYYQKKVDIVLDNGTIVEIGSGIKTSPKDEIIEGKDLIIFPSLVDIYSTSGDLNQFEAETLETLIDAAEAGGVGFVAHLPSSSSPIVDKSTISYLTSRNDKSISQIVPNGSIFTPYGGILAPLREMSDVGAKAFANGTKAIDNLDEIKLALQYANGFDGKLMIYTEKTDLTQHAQMNEGVMSVSLGLIGASAESEYIAVRDLLDIIEYTDSKALLYGLSCAESIDLIDKFNSKNKRVWSAVSSLHLMYDDSALSDFDTNFKVNPPYRSEKNRKKLVSQLKSNKIDIVYSQHIPKTEESKRVEFLYADNGSINIQTSFLASYSILGNENLETIIDVMCLNPANYLEIDLPVIEKKSKGFFTIFDRKENTEYTLESNKSKSKNSPLLGQTLDGKMVGIVGNNKFKKF